MRICPRCKTGVGPHKPRDKRCITFNSTCPELRGRRRSIRSFPRLTSNICARHKHRCSARSQLKYLMRSWHLDDIIVRNGVVEQIIVVQILCAKTANATHSQMVTPGELSLRSDPRTPRKLSPSVATLGLVSMLTAISSAMIYGLLPLSMVKVLAISVASVGFIEGMAEAANSLVKIVSGAASDYMGRRKPLVLLGYTLSAMIKTIFPVADTAFPILAASCNLVRYAIIVFSACCRFRRQCVPDFVGSLPSFARAVLAAPSRSRVRSLRA